MEKTQKRHIKAGKPPVTKKKKNKGKFPRGAKNIYCVLCRSSYAKHEAHEHMHSMLHHRELETVLGTGSYHDCHVCKAVSLSLNEYAQHISTSQHNAKLKSLMFKNVKPLPLLNILGKETLDRILDRNKKLKTQERKAMKKHRKRLKQQAGQKRVEKLQGGSGINTVVSKTVQEQRPKQVNMRILKQMQGTHQQGSNTAVFQNKENKMSSLQRPTFQRELTQQNQSGRLSFSPEEPAGQTWTQPTVRDQYTQSVQQMRLNGNFSVGNHGSRAKIESPQTDRRPHSTQGGASNQPEQKAYPVHSQTDYYNEHYTSGTDSDFTSDHLPQSGAFIFDQNESLTSSQPGQGGSQTAKSASANRSESSSPIRDVDVNSMLRQIRRALGVREPCRADREARRQNSEAGNRAADQGGAEKEQPTGGTHIPSAAATSVQSSHVNSPSPASRSFPSSIPPAKPKQITVTVTQGMTQQYERSSMVAGSSNGPSNSKESDSQVAHDSQTSLSCSSWAASSKPNMNITRKVRIARKAAGNLLGLSGPQSKPSWRQMYEEMKRKKLERVKGMPRFGIHLTNRAEKEQSTRAEEKDMPLSEGFHWESFPDSPSAAHWAGLPAPLRDTTVNDSHTETQSDSQVQEPSKQPGAAQESCSDQTVEAAPVKVEPDLEDDSRDLGSTSSANKRKPNMYGGVCDEQQSGKKKRTKSQKDQDQMDQLLTVSLREEELSHSLQDLDKSLDRARIALQAAYTEVQRLLLMRQQCTSEVNSLRAKRIEILQGMQGGYSGGSNAAEKANSFSAGAAAAVVQPQLSPLPSPGAFPTASFQQPPPTNSASSIIQPHTSPLNLPAVPLKQEMSQLPTVSNPDAPQVPVTPPGALFPSNLLPSLLLTSPHLAAPTSSVSSFTQLRTESSTSAITSPKSSAGLQEQVAREGLKDCVQTVRLVSEDEQEVDSEEEILTAVESVPAVTLVEDGGDESDDSVEMMKPSNMVVIDIDESDNEEVVSKAPVHKEPPQKSVSVEFSSAGTKTSQQIHAERKVQPPVKEEAPLESIEVLDEEDLYLGPFMNHTGAVLGLQVHEGRLYTCSGDNTARAYSLMSNECQAVFEGHTNKVNCLLVASPPNTLARLYTGSSDQTIRCYSIKTNKCLEQISLSDRVLCLHVAWNTLFAGLANGSVASYDLKTLKQLDVFECHGPRGVSCLGTAQEGARRVLLVGSYDSTISVRDAKSGLLLRSLQGHTKTVLCMKVVNDLVFSGSSDTSVHAYNIHTGELIRIYKGHGHAVTAIVILGKVMVTASLDQLIRVYELQSHDRLQVYGGHSDMVMCMAVHKSVIYTGCYDGSVQAVKLNLMKNYRCWWQNCSLIFGMAEHLVQHLVRDHSNPNLQTVKCRWRSCSTFFSKQQMVRQELPEHMKSHVEKDSEVQP
uniref:zinc finger protein 106 isoform X2 n=1 Tax=Semicossyphus pulcher TaxID=241346 RepID=UPI0037E8FD25